MGRTGGGSRCGRLVLLTRVCGEAGHHVLSHGPMEFWAVCGVSFCELPLLLQIWRWIGEFLCRKYGMFFDRYCTWVSEIDTAHKNAA